MGSFTFRGTFFRSFDQIDIHFGVTCPGPSLNRPQNGHESELVVSGVAVMKRMCHAKVLEFVRSVLAQVKF